MSDRTSDVVAGIGLLAVMFPFMILANALAIKYGWNSIMMPVFDLQAINGYQAYGLSCIVSYLTAADITANNKTGRESKGKDLWQIMGSAAALGFGRPLFFVVTVWILLWFAAPLGMTGG